VAGSDDEQAAHSSRTYDFGENEEGYQAEEKVCIVDQALL